MMIGVISNWKIRSEQEELEAIRTLLETEETAMPISRERGFRELGA